MPEAEKVQLPVRKACLSLAAEVIVSCCLASLGLYVLDPADLRIVKIVVYSRAVTNGAYLFGDMTGLYKPVESSKDPRRFTFESALALAASTFLCYSFVYETN